MTWFSQSITLPIYVSLFDKTSNKRPSTETIPSCQKSTVVRVRSTVCPHNPAPLPPDTTHQTRQPTKRSVTLQYLPLQRSQSARTGGTRIKIADKGSKIIITNLKKYIEIKI